MSTEHDFTTGSPQLTWYSRSSRSIRECATLSLSLSLSLVFLSISVRLPVRPLTTQARAGPRGGGPHAHAMADLRGPSVDVRFFVQQRLAGRQRRLGAPPLLRRASPAQIQSQPRGTSLPSILLSGGAFVSKKKICSKITQLLILSTALGPHAPLRADLPGLPTVLPGHLRCPSGARSQCTTGRRLWT
jgi:hypothetical protein